MMRQFDIFIYHVEWAEGGKSRPVMAFIIDGNIVEVYQITTKYNTKSERIKSLYFKINDWKQAGLNKQSYVDTGTLIELEMYSFKGKKPIGRLSYNDMARFLEFLSV